MIQPAAATLGRQIEVLSAGTSRVIDDVLASLAQNQVDALLVAPSPVLYSYRVQIALTVPPMLLTIADQVIE
jgi:hypothetical protein